MKARDIVIAVAVGIGAAILRIGYVFFPLFNLVDVVVFGTAGYGIGRSHPARRWLSFLLVVLPALCFIGFVMIVLGPAKLREGVGVGHVYGAALIPLAAWLGFLAAGRGRKQGTSA